MTSPLSSSPSQSDQPVSTPVSVNGHRALPAPSPEMVTLAFSIVASLVKLWRLWKEEHH